MPTPSSYDMNAKIDYILLRAMPESSRRRNAPDFTSKVTTSLRQLFDNLGGTVTSISIGKDDIAISWDGKGIDPLKGIVKLLEQAKYPEAILLLELFKSARPDDTDFLYNLGMAYSDLGELERALTNLNRLLELIPDHVNGRVALGVALMRQGQDEQALIELRRAVQDDPTNPFAQRNLGAILLQLGDYQEALPHLEKSTKFNPTDQRAWFGLARAYELAGTIEKADAAYLKVLELDEYNEVAEKAKDARSRIAQDTFRSAIPGMERMDAVMYCLGALEMYQTMTLEQVRQVGFEIAMLGMNGIDVNDPTKKYQIKSIPGSFSGLHLVCLEYVAFKQFAPEMDIGFDLSKEFESARKLFSKRNDENWSHQL